MTETDLEDPDDPEPAETPEGEADRPAPAPDEAEPATVEAPPEPEERPDGAEPVEADPEPAETLPDEEAAAAPPEDPTRGDPEATPETVVSVDDDLAARPPMEPTPEGEPAPPSRQGPPPEELEASLDRLAETLTQLSKSIDEIKAFRDEMEDRLSDVEERMVRLGSLAEAVSMQYNPFLEEEGDVRSTTSGPRRSGQGDDPTIRPDPVQPQDPPDDPEPGEANPATGGPAAERSPSKDPLERRMLVMEWVKFLIDRVGRVRLLDLLEYYEELGWLDGTEREQIMKVAVGVDGPDRVEGADWKGDRELHERSLIALERLRGREVTGQTIDSLHLDLDRLFGG